MLSPRISIKLDVYRGGALIRSKTFEEPVIKIGSLASSHLPLEDEQVSRMHAMVELTSDGEVLLRDLGSRGGTFVNGRKSALSPLHSGDEVQIGETQIRVELLPCAAPLGEPVAEPVLAGTPPGGPRATELQARPRRSQVRSRLQIAALMLFAAAFLLLLLRLLIR